MAHNYEAGGSGLGHGDDDAWLSMLSAGGGPVDLRPEPETQGDADDEMEETIRQEAPRTDTSGGEGQTGSGTGDATSGSEASRKRKERRHNMLATTRQEFTVVDPKSGTPIEPESYAKGYGNQIGCIARDFGNVNTGQLRDKENKAMAALLIEKLHTRYKFPDPYDNQELKSNLVNSLALGKFTKAFTTWRSSLREMIAKGKGFNEIHKTWPSISEEDLAQFKIDELKPERVALSKWGKEQRKKNIGPHNLGSRGYLGKQKVWAKEDAKREGPNPFDKITDPQVRNFVRAHYREDPKKPGDLVLNEKVKLLENKYLEEKEKERLSQSDGGSSATTNKDPYDTPFIRALNAMKGVPLDKKPHRGHVHGLGKGHRHAHYYPDTKEKRKERNKGPEKTVDELVNERLNELLPTICASVAQSLAPWMLGGGQGPLPEINIAQMVQPVPQNVAPVVAPQNVAPVPAPQNVAPVLAPQNVAPVVAPRNEPAPNPQPEGRKDPSPPRHISSTPPPTLSGPSPLSELNALTVIQCPLLNYIL